MDQIEVLQVPPGDKALRNRELLRQNAEGSQKAIEGENLEGANVLKCTKGPIANIHENPDKEQEEP